MGCRSLKLQVQFLSVHVHAVIYDKCTVLLLQSACSLAQRQSVLQYPVEYGLMRGSLARYAVKEHVEHTDDADDLPRTETAMAEQEYG